MYSVSFTDFTPSARFDGISWVSALIQESSAKDGPWTTIDTKNFPPDSNPAVPASHSFTTENATLEAGWYRIVWVDQTGDQQQPTLPLHNAPEPSDYFKPTIREVANEILSRTRDANGVLLGTFTSETTPTDEKVAEMIQQAADEVEAVVDDDLPESVWDTARQVIAIRTAMQIELSFYSDQVESGRSPYAQLRQQYEDALEYLATATAREQEEDAAGVESPLTPMMARGSFPDAQPWLTRPL
jgi:hypothetical protein